MHWWQRCTKLLLLPVYEAWLLPGCGVSNASLALGWAGVEPARRVRGLSASHTSAAEWCTRAGTRTWELGRAGRSRRRPAAAEANPRKPSQGGPVLHWSWPRPRVGPPERCFAGGQQRPIRPRAKAGHPVLASTPQFASYTRLTTSRACSKHSSEALLPALSTTASRGDVWCEQLTVFHKRS